MATSTKRKRTTKATATTRKSKAAPAKVATPPKKKKPAVARRPAMSEQERCATVARTLQRALRRHPKLKGVRVVAKGVRLSFFEVPQESVDVFATILERMWSKVRRYVE